MERRGLRVQYLCSCSCGYNRTECLIRGEAMEVTGEKKGSSTRGVEYPMAKMLIRESIVSDNSSNGNGDEESKAGAQDPDGVLAFSRSVHKIDSSVLE
ncbi:hypothetical protein NC653_040261 [Populus alba x Populus x berolinensis]|uniref:Uncharacterized protein n=2 Tax=Populus TaxID=3689 RepID=A0AAD6LDF0_9ROSI|nr:hypothetical protein NC653_040261 [Populus alba x Populus x berolinensis]